MNGELSTRQKILKAAIDLFSQKGFKGVTTKEIAKSAGVNEVTLFRQFGSKKKLFEDVMEEFYFESEFKKVFEEGLSWDLEKDLLCISRIYYEHMRANKKLIRTGLRECTSENGLHFPHEKFPKKIKEVLVEYFTQMQSRGKMIKEDPEMQAVIFLFMNFGSSMNYEIADIEITDIGLEDFIKSSVELFVKSWRV